MKGRETTQNTGTIKDRPFSVGSVPSVILSEWLVHLVSSSLCHSNSTAFCSGVGRLVMT